LKVTRAEGAFVESLRPANGAQPNPSLAGLLNRLTALRLHQVSNGKIRASGVFETPYELEKSGHADFLKWADNILIPAMRCFDAPPPSQPQSPKAA
jgi:hypothetical protein